MAIVNYIKAGLAALGIYVGIKTARKFWNLIMAGLIIYSISKLFGYIPQIQQFTSKVMYVYMLFVGIYLWVSKKVVQTPETKMEIVETDLHREMRRSFCPYHEAYHGRCSEYGFIDSVKDSPRTVSAVIIVLFFAAAIYTLSGNERVPVDSKVGQTISVDGQEVKVIEDRRRSMLVESSEGNLWINKTAMEFPKCKEGQTAYMSDNSIEKILRYDARDDTYYVEGGGWEHAYDIRKCE